jgi:FKBP-type peptidyl-prolyl cis-trans isomerase
MKNLILVSLLSVLIIGGVSCIKSAVTPGCTDKLVSSEAAAIQQYATDHGFSGVVDPASGVYIQVLNPGNGPVPLSTSRVFVKYTGRLASTNGVFEEQTNHLETGWVLGSLIPGWQIGLGTIQKGGKVRLIIPSSLAYGCRGVAAIPGDAILFFEIELVDVQ